MVSSLMELRDQFRPAVQYRQDPVRLGWRQTDIHPRNAKIAAPFQPEQGLRYAARGQRWSTAEGITRVVTVLIAPDGYMSRPGAEAFEVRIPYEELSAALREENAVRVQNIG